MGKLYTVSKKQDLELTGSDHQLLIANFRLKLRKWREPSARSDLHQIPYEYAVEVINRVKRLDLVTVCLRNYGWRFIILYRRHQKNRPKEKEKQEGKVVI